MSIRTQILDLFAKLNQNLGSAFLFITHDLTAARTITGDVLVMHEGMIVERGKTSEVLDRPQTEAAQALISAAKTCIGQLPGHFRNKGEQPVRVENSSCQ